MYSINKWVVALTTSIGQKSIAPIRNSVCRIRRFDKDMMGKLAKWSTTIPLILVSDLFHRQRESICDRIKLSGKPVCKDRKPDTHRSIDQESTWQGNIPIFKMGHPQQASRRVDVSHRFGGALVQRLEYGSGSLPCSDVWHGLKIQSFHRRSKPMGL